MMLPSALRWKRPFTRGGSIDWKLLVEIDVPAAFTEVLLSLF